MPEPKEPTIEEHIAKARELTPQQTRVTEPAFEELIRAFEKALVELRELETDVSAIKHAPEPETTEPEPDYNPVGDDL